MATASGSRSDWLKLLLSTEPADRSRAELGVRQFYTGSGLAAPRYFLWFDSPYDAAWTVALLATEEDDPWKLIVRQASRFPAQRQKIEAIQSDICHRLAEAGWPGVCAAAGLPLESLGMRNPLAQIFDLRCTLYANVEAARKASSFAVAADDLFRAETHFLGLPGGVLGNQECARPVGILINASIRSLYPCSLIAADQAQHRTPPPQLAALWEVAASCGPWWGFEHAAILTERPAELHLDDRFLLHRADGPAVVYRDGAQGWAWNGHSATEDEILHPENIPPGIFAKADPAFQQQARTRLSRIPRPRKIRTDGAFLTRYMAGEHEQVWKDLVALGPDIRQPRYLPEAVEVARETMRRVERNVRTVVGRLQILNYRFKTKGMWLDDLAARSDAILDLPGAANSPYAGSLRESTARQRKNRRPEDYLVRAHVQPGPDAARHLQELEKLAGPIPLSLWAFYEIVGEVDLIGRHETISPNADPLVVFPLEAMLQECADEIVQDGRIPIAPDHFHKADISGGLPYEIALPDARADAELLNEPHRLFFVDYLRLVFRHGGFPGYAGMDRDVPQEIAMLAQHLEPF